MGWLLLSLHTNCRLIDAPRKVRAHAEALGFNALEIASTVYLTVRGPIRMAVTWPLRASRSNVLVLTPSTAAACFRTSSCRSLCSFPPSRGLPYVGDSIRNLANDGSELGQKAICGAITEAGRWDGPLVAVRK